MMRIDLSYLYKGFEAEMKHGLDHVESLYLEKNNNLDYVDFLYTKGIICILEHDTLMNMINSPDKENYEMAKAILQNKSENIKPCQ